MILTERFLQCSEGPAVHYNVLHYRSVVKLRRFIYNPYIHIWRNVFVKIVNGWTFKPLAVFMKKLYHECLTGSLIQAWGLQPVVNKVITNIQESYILRYSCLEFPFTYIALGRNSTCYPRISTLVYIEWWRCLHIPI